jgi:hypothetical protein
LFDRVGKRGAGKKILQFLGETKACLRPSIRISFIIFGACIRKNTEVEWKMNRPTWIFIAITLSFVLVSTSWAQVNRILPPPEGGRIEAVVIDPFDFLVVYVGIRAEGVFEIVRDAPSQPLPSSSAGGDGCFIQALFPAPSN